MTEEHEDIECDKTIADEEHEDCAVLIVDDDEALCRLIQKNLQSEGLRTQYALNGAEAIEQAIQSPDALLLLDYQLPDMTGKQVVEALNHSRSSNPFIIMTGHGDEKVAVEMMKIGARDYLVKDIEFLDLLPAVVHQVVEQLGVEKMLVEAAEALQRSKEELRESMLEKRVMRSEKLVALGRLSASLVHELSNPLDGTRRYMRLMLEQIPRDDPVRSYAEYVRDGLTRMAEMISGLADFARKSRQISVPIDIIQSIRDALCASGKQISAQNIKVKTEFDMDTSVVLGAGVSQIFGNIIKNAIQAMPDGGTLFIEGKMIAPEIFEARFSDTGPGVPDEIGERIFEPFFTTKDGGQGVGLGLFIGQGIAESYNGSIAVENTSGNGGATFIVTLPIGDNGLESWI